MFRFFFKRHVRRVRRRRRSRSTIGFERHKHQARALVLQKLDQFNAAYGFLFAKVFVKNHISRWGSCSKKGNLNFNYKIALLPVRLVDYIIVHELCHLGEFNHSKNFWALVAQTIPDYAARRKELRLVKT